MPQDLIHDDYPRPTQAALPRLHEIRVNTLLLTGDADIPDVHAQAGVIEAGIHGSRRRGFDGCRLFDVSRKAGGIQQPGNWFHLR